MNIKVYAPVDCEVKEITKCSDKTFSQKMMGEGIVIVPIKNNFVLPFDKGLVSVIFDTKHAFGFEINENLSSIIHCGLETVSLEGKPFDVKIKENTYLQKGDPIFDVDLKYLKSQNVSSETPIIFEPASDKTIKLTNLKEGKAKQGDLICEIEISNKIQSSKDFFVTKNKYQNAYSIINTAVGLKSNYSEVYNCMTRLRFKIIDKNLVNEENIKANELVKGLVWNGNELQVVIGQDVYKLKEEFMKMNEFAESVGKSEKTKSSYFKRFLQMFGSILPKLIPVFIGFGMIQAIIGILVWTKIMPNFSVTIESIKDLVNVKGFDIFWLILFATGKSSNLFIGIFVAYAASEYFNLRKMIGIGIGVTLCSPILFLSGGLLGIGGEWELFNLGKINVSDPGLQMVLDRLTSIVITPGNIKLFVIIFAIFIAKKLDDWIGTWVSPIFELTVRPFLVFSITILLSFCICMPIWNFFESILSVLMYYAGKIPFGIGVGLYAMLWQLAVILGLHLVLGIVGMVQVLTSIQLGNGGYGIFGLGGSISVYAQLGALISIIIVTKNYNLKKAAISMIPVGVLGITEPIIYGINLPEKKPFLAGLIAAFIAGAFAGIMGVTQRIGTGIGVFEIFGYFQSTIYDPNNEVIGELSNLANGLLYITSCLIALGSGILIGLFIYRGRTDEKKLIIQTNKKLNKFLVTKYNLNDSDKKALVEKINMLDNVITDEYVRQFKDIEKKYSEISKAQAKIEIIKSKNDKKVNSLIKKGQLALNKNNIEKADAIRDQIIALKEELNIFINKLEKSIIEIRNTIDLEELKILHDSKLEQIIKIIETLGYEINLNLLANNYSNNLNSLLISYKEVNLNTDILNLKIKKEKR
ncbi:glucose PTS transporter subunit IIA [Mesoplasma tabanidae]|uniref:PTS system, beta-glucoside-specific IIABC component n=1 Tax=Mesoplasma tabanidae TaxID=219745 RepID=A0A2K8P7V2_9MOLU|nr:glucose PTS transporter subunit IIA [Mesoplasma tabanidae]ATZ21675.1 PTS system, beta-glucoside-specific IIABC component [Mesoplasma tabanidae]